MLFSFSKNNSQTTPQTLTYATTTERKNNIGKPHIFSPDKICCK